MVTEWLHLFFESVGDILSNSVKIWTKLHDTKATSHPLKENSHSTACTATVPLFNHYIYIKNMFSFVIKYHFNEA